MIIELGFTGSDRKELVKAVSEIIRAPAEYQYMPTCAYKIGIDYTVRKVIPFETPPHTSHTGGFVLPSYSTQ